MKPINLKISAFGPYKDEIEIDFTKFDGNGIFLITGDTGSGKTTIFDAICFALYGVASGSNRGKTSFRSDFAKDNVKTFVKFSFIHKEIKYEIERIPSYMRKKLRGDGYTQVSGDASMIYQDKLITGEKNVTEECIKILGMNALQFKQISMIAQGEFLKLLLAKASDRADIFRKIFDTYIYKNISDKLKKKYLGKKREYEDIGINIDSLKDNLIIDEEIDLNDLNVIEILSIIEDKNKKDDILVKELEKEKKELLEKIQKIVSDIDSAKMINDNLDKYGIAKKELKIKEEQKKDIKIKKEVLKKNKDISDIIMPLFNEFVRVKEIVNNKKNELKEKKNSLLKVKGEYRDISDKYKSINKIQDDINRMKIDLDKLEQKKPIFVEIKDLKKKIEDKYNIYNLLKINSYKQILDKFKFVEDIEKKYKNEEKKFKNMRSKYNELSNRYNIDYNKFINCQAGIIADTLEDNRPCPVCGSLDHPSPAKTDNDYINKEYIDDEYDSLIKCQKELEIISNNVSSFKKEWEFNLIDVDKYDEEEIKNNVKLCQKNVKKEVDVSKYNLSDIEEEINYLKVSIDTKSKLIDKDITEEIIDNNIKELKNNIDEKSLEVRDIITNYEFKNKKMIRLDSLIESIKKDIEKLENDKIKKENEYVEGYNKLGYKSEEEYLKNKLGNDIIDNYEEEINNYNKDVLELNKEIQVLESINKGKDYIGIEDFVKEKEILNNILSNNEISLKNISNRLNSNKMIYNKLKNIYNKVKKTEEELAIYEDLSNTANGNIKGKNKLEFEQYVQAGYFDNVLVSANKRFGYMTDGRYLLVRRKESNRISDKLGLELEVMDNYTGKKREINSLSGGESFKASLSLAFGMSDVIQSYAGGIVVDVMFIDEGFGSLDTESLESAISAILKLSNNNKLIGIISHVSELKDRIDKKIVVKKGNTGSIVSVVI